MFSEILNAYKNFWIQAGILKDLIVDLIGGGYNYLISSFQ